MHIAPEALRAARVAMLQAAVAAYYMDVQDDGCDGLVIEAHPVAGELSITATHSARGVAVIQYSL